MAEQEFLNYARDDGGNVSVPRRLRTRPNSSEVELAYITPKEAGILSALKPGSPHRGPMEIPNYDSFDAARNYTSGAAMSAAETGSRNQRDRAEVRASNIGGPKGLAPGVTSNQAQDLRNSFLNARAMGQRGSGIGGFFGGLGRGLLSFFGGIPGKLMSGIMTAQDWATKKGQNFGKGVQTFNQYPTLDRWLNRNTDKYLNKPYRGQGQGYNFNEDPSGRIVKDPDLYADQMKEFQMKYPLDVSKYNQGITGTDAYETFDDEVALSKMLANRMDQSAYEEFEPNELAEQDYLSEIEGDLAFKPNSRKDKRLRTLHNQKTDGLFWNEQNQKEYEQLLKEDAEQTDYPKSVIT